MNVTAQDMIHANIARDAVAEAFPEWLIMALPDSVQNIILAVAATASALASEGSNPDPFVGHLPAESEYWTADVYDMQDYRDRMRA